MSELGKVVSALLFGSGVGCIFFLILCVIVGLPSVKGVVYGSEVTATSVACVEPVKVFKYTKEGKLVEDQDVEKGSARYIVLYNRGQKTIFKVCKVVGRREGYDMLVVKGKKTKLPQTDITDKVIKELSKKEQ